VLEAKLEAALEPDPQMGVLDHGLLRLEDAQVPGHPQVDDQPLLGPIRQGAVERHDDVLSAAFHPLQAPVPQLTSEGRGVLGIAQDAAQHRAVAGQPHRPDESSAELWAQVAHHGLDFRQLGQGD